MFDIGFLELLVVLIIALLVIGPERMPEVARKLGSFIGKTKRFINSVKEEGQLQETVRELKESMDLQQEQKQLQQLEQDLNNSFIESTADIDPESLTRPSFGGAARPLDEPVTSQYSKAPAQPVLPTQEAPNPSQPTKQDESKEVSEEAPAPKESAQTSSETSRTQTEAKSS
ncbi:Sec-independent protein translocase protein TatB [Thiomicrorhabdus sp. zzn3]|uniref:Sec-independent protein translocase protein TatB n=1 Tax=Thiomicrorhabdus sp. zzn3 TaxID=3039775 RepID=UPI002436DD07|nr:Sec-independent protein translocase protein TatB [Thiomicrorhabdus sp. zzn3]MDG6778901.1 Sec-independent protein translocase protein TatB [Thiomicrorhabdus sp. zzn3]